MHSRLLESSAWVGLLSGAAAASAAASAPAPPVLVGAITPHDLTEWAGAIAAAVSAVTAALNGLAILWYRLKRGQAPKDAGE